MLKDFSSSLLDRVDVAGIHKGGIDGLVYACVVTSSCKATMSVIDMSYTDNVSGCSFFFLLLACAISGDVWS